VAGETSRPFLPLFFRIPFRRRAVDPSATMRLLFVVLVGLLVLIQYPLWLGQGSWSRVWRLDQSLALQREVNAGKRLRNEGLEAEVEDLKSGRSAVEERARYGLGMVKPDEIFVQINPAPDSPATGH
jgi:cell division protein ftsB homolog